MGIQNFISKRLNQTVVYWGSPVSNGRGGHTYDPPVEIACRWEERSEVRSSDDGEEYISKAVVYLEDGVVKNGMLYLGTLQNIIDLDAGDSADSAGTVYLLDPHDIDNAYLIKDFEKTPALNSTTEFMRKAYL